MTVSPVTGRIASQSGRGRRSSARVQEGVVRYRILQRAYVLLLVACVFYLGKPRAIAAGKKYPSPPPGFFQSNGIGKPLVIAPGDVLTVRFYSEPKLNKTVRVRQDGKISLDLLQGVDAAGLQPEALQQKLTELYVHELTNPGITVDVESQANSSVYVTGEVLVPGAKEIRANMTVGMVLAMSQVVQKTAGTKSIFLIRATENSKYTIYQLDASMPGGSGGAVQVIPGDVYFVPRKGIVKADDFIEQYVRQLLPATANGNADVLFTPGNPVASSVAATQ